MENLKYKDWENKSFYFLDGTFYRQRFKDNKATIVKIGPILAHFQVHPHPTIYTMPLQNLDPNQKIIRKEE